MDKTMTRHIEDLLDRGLRFGETTATTELLSLAEEDRSGSDTIRNNLLTRLRAGVDPAEMRGVAELLAEIEARRRVEQTRRIVSHRSQVRGLRALLADLDDVTAAERPYVVTRRLCDDLGFRKSVYSPVNRPGWCPRTIAFHADLGRSFEPLRRAIEELALPPGAAPREEEVMRSARSLAVDPADVYTNTYRPLVELSNPKGYLVVPVVAAGRVTAVLHADHHDIDLHDSDLTVLQNAATLCALTQERNALRAVIARRRTRAADALVALGTALGDISETHLEIGDALRSIAPDGEQTSTDMPRSGSCNVLSAREHEIFEHLALGASNSDIAGSLVLADSTVKSHIKRIYRKLGVATRAEAAALYRSVHSLS